MMRTYDTLLLVIENECIIRQILNYLHPNQHNVQPPIYAVHYNANLGYRQENTDKGIIG